MNLENIVYLLACVLMGLLIGNTSTNLKMVIRVFIIYGLGLILGAYGMLLSIPLY